MYGVLYNPISGRGLAKSYAEQISDYFTLNGEEVSLFESLKDAIHEDFGGELKGLIVVGGDGTLRPYLPLLAKLQISCILFPAGNESLIAQQFKVSPNVSELYKRVKRNSPSQHFFGKANEEPFFLMCSVGFDAEVVHWVENHRKTYSSDLLYAKGIFASILRPSILYRLILLDNVDVIRGTTIVSNSSFYGGGISPLPNADSSEDYFLIRSFLGSYLSNGIKLIFLKLGLNRSFNEIKSKSIIIESCDKESLKFQIDGEARDSQGELRIEISTERVLFY